MKAEVGQVIGFWTRDVLNPGQTGGGYKYHLCVDADRGLHLFVCSDEFPFDYKLTLLDCPGLSAETSFVSLSRVIARADVPKTNRVACRVSDAYLRALMDHLADVQTLSARDKDAIAVGIATYLNSKTK